MAPSETNADVPIVGFDPVLIERRLTSVAEVARPLTGARLPGGHSNLTYAGAPS